MFVIFCLALLWVAFMCGECGGIKTSMAGSCRETFKNIPKSNASCKCTSAGSIDRALMTVAATQQVHCVMSPINSSSIL